MTKLKFYDWCELWAKTHNKSVRQFCLEAGFAVELVSRYKHGKVKPYRTNCERLAAFLEIEPSQIEEWTPVPVEAEPKGKWHKTGKDKKYCNRCKDWLPLEKFSFYWSKTRQKNVVSPYCLEHMREHLRESARKRKARKLAS